MKQPSVETKKDYRDELVIKAEILNIIDGVSNEQNHLWIIEEINRLYKRIELTQQAQMREEINLAIDNVKYMKFFSSSRALEELRDDVSNILGEGEM